MSRIRILTLAAVSTLTAASLAACSSADSPSTSTTATGGDKLAVVASTNIYGSIAEAIGGDTIEVTSIITDPAADPHSYEATAQDMATLSDADLVIYNGGHYDYWVEKAVADSTKPALNAVDIAASEAVAQLRADYAAGTHDHDHAGHDHGEHAHPEGEAHDHGAESSPASAAAVTTTPGEDHAGHDHSAEGHDHAGHDHSHDHAGHNHSHGDANEHVWYDLATAHVLAQQIHDTLVDLNSADADLYAANLAAFNTEIDSLVHRVEHIHSGHQGTSFIQTEPVAQYLVDAAGLRDASPQSYQVALISESEPAAADIAAVKDLITARQVDLLLINTQTEDAVATQLHSAAKDAGVEVVEVMETLPPSTTYLELMGRTLDSIEHALGH